MKQTAYVVSSQPQKMWRESRVAVRDSTAQADVHADCDAQAWEGFGGCFNELGWVALDRVPRSSRASVMRDIFGTGVGCGFTRCRMPIGASDYACSWYSLNDCDGDFAMRRFSVARDRECLFKYIKAALAVQPAMKVFASPWSPPTWLKRPAVYNHGTLVWEPRYLKAYALYFVNFAKACEAEGIPLDQLHVQNEPVADQKFPSCLWTGAQMRDFIRDYLAPALRTAGVDCEVWLGTLNTDDYHGFPNTVLSDPAARRAVSGVGFQWAGKGAIQRTHQSWPDVRLMQTENECGDGTNTWTYAQYVFDLAQHYIANGANAYVYWNMVLANGGKSTWGWPQNSMVSVDLKSGAVTRNPEFYVMKHLSAFVRPAHACRSSPVRGLRARARSEQFRANLSLQFVTRSSARRA